MTLKRKASFTTITSPRTISTYNASIPPISCQLGNTITIDETPRHLHSRTRKRFKPDRPDEQSIYDKTLRWLFSAQNGSRRQEQTSISSENEISLDDAPPSSVPDPGQQTLRRFFQPRRSCSSGFSDVLSNNSSAQSCPSETSLVNLTTAQVEPNMCATSSHCMDVDMDISMEMDSVSDSTIPMPGGGKKWVGGLGWM
ncbi:hypothetical protein LOZ15_006054 [Ophidiomyces ophidiicola]|nr:hypothetical protein LOZ15_006054 [Ophidiomyces ophidiicola]